jgi:hypothetical protein
MAGFVKIQSSILQSTIWREENHVRILWITMLTLSDKEGVVEGSIPGLADIARITIEECKDGLNRLMSPDEYSRTKDFCGKRIGEIEGGWVILNYEKYREPTSKDRTRAWRERNREKPELQSDCANVTSHYVTERHNCHNASPSASDSASDSTSSFSLYSDNKTNTKVKKYDYKDISRKYLDIFNAVFDRRTNAVSIVSSKIEKRLKDGVPEWQILSAPVILKAMDPKFDKLQGFNAEVPLRDGKHPRTTQYGTCGATNWIEKAFLSVDTVILDRRLTEIAQYFGIFDDLKDKVKAYYEPDSAI